MPNWSSSTAAVLLPRIESRIVVLRGLRVMIDTDLAVLYGVATKRLNEQVKRNVERFPGDFMFQLTADEKTEVVANCDHLTKLKFSKALPYAFTEHGAIQAANVLASPQAVEMGIFVVRAFVRMRELAAVHADLAKRLHDLEEKAEGLALSHDTFSHNIRAQLKQLIEAVNSQGQVLPFDCLISIREYLSCPPVCASHFRQAQRPQSGIGVGRAQRHCN